MLLVLGESLETWHIETFGEKKSRLMLASRCSNQTLYHADNHFDISHGLRARFTVSPSCSEFLKIA